MIYHYSQNNRLDEPHNYMYTPFQGEELLRSYQSSRLAVLHQPCNAEYGDLTPDSEFVTYSVPELERLINARTLEGSEKFSAYFFGDIKKPKMECSNLGDLAEGLERFTIIEYISTLNLLHAVIAAQLTDRNEIEIKTWLDRLTQRFEVTKKLYEFYPPGFRKGEGEHTLIRLYWLFSLSLSLYHARSSEVKYLSTLLKVVDLLCSLPSNLLRGQIPEHGLSAVLATEIVCVRLLAEKKGVTFCA